MAIFLPRLPTDRLRRSGVSPSDGRPFALFAKEANAFLLTDVDLRAEEAGLKAGMPVADARAMRPDLATFESDAAADIRLLETIADWCDRFTPVVALDPPNGLFLNIAGSAHLFGGEERLRQNIEARLTAQDFAARAAIAPTPGAAYALARFGQTKSADVSTLNNALAPLPLAALRLEPQAAALLKRLGLQRIGQIIGAPRQPLAARIGAGVVRRLDQALGLASEALTPRRPPPPVFALRLLVEPVIDLDAVGIVIETLSKDLCAKLEKVGAGARLLRLSLFGVDNRTRTLDLGVSRPSRDAKQMLRLFRERLGVFPEALDAEFGFEAARLDAVLIAPLVATAIDLAPVDDLDPGALPRLIDTLAARLGPGCIGNVVLKDTHQPENASRFENLDLQGKSPDQRRAPSRRAASGMTGARADGVMRRPLRFFPRAQRIEAIASVPDGPPARFRWRRVTHEIVRAEGPERIAPDWLAGPGARTRDYYRVEDKEGRRFWLYREGLYEEQDAPRWFLHGLFS